MFRIGTISELRTLWGNNNLPTQNYFIKGISEGNIEFWTVEDENSNRSIGELYIIWNSEDKDEADRESRAYL